MRRRPVPLLLIALACARAPEPAPLDLTRADPERILSDVAWLADDAREGRGLATRGLAEAARYVADSFQQAGLEPGGSGSSYLQGFETPVSIAIESAELAVADQALVRGSDFEAFLTSASGSVEGELVFAGHGISDEESGWDDYAELDADGRIVLVLDDRPRRPEGPLGGALGVRFLRRAYKFANARRHGAAAVLVAPAAEAPGLPGSAGSENANPMRQASGIVTLAVSRAVAEGLVASAGGASLAELQESIDARQSPASAALGVPVRASVEIQREKGRIANVVGIRRGSDPALSKQTVVVGAHLDHLGRGEYGSLAPDRRGEIHNGADDNASGVAGLLELARLLGRGPAPRRNVVIVAFTGEEAGLSGSSHHAANPAIPDSETVAMLNLDMIGRLRDGELTVFGAETSPGFEALVKAEASELALQPAFAEGAFGPSDQTSFHSQGVPVLFFFTGTHEQYHTPDDDTELVNATGEAVVVQLLERVVRRLADAPQRPVLVQVERPEPSRGGQGYGPYLGTVPDFAGAPVRGVRLQAVRPSSPAEQAGIRGGDVIVEFQGAPVANLEEFSALLFGARAGEQVEIVLERDGARLTTTATLGQRR